MGLEDPELPGEDFLITFNKELKGKWAWRIRRSREEISLLFLIRNCKEKRGRRIRILQGGDFLIIFNKELKGAHMLTCRKSCTRSCITVACG